MRACTTYRRIALGLLTLVLALTAAPAVAADDTTPPALGSISLSTTGPYAPGTQVGFAWTATDAGGIDRVEVHVADSDGALHLFEGSAVDDVRQTITAAGWTLGDTEVDFIKVVDTSDNQAFYTADGVVEYYPSGDVATHTINFAALSFRVGATTTDGAPPVLSEFGFDPQAVDVTSGAKNVTVTARITDATGVQTPTMVLSSDDHVNRQRLGAGPMTRISGDVKNGVYQRVVSIPPTAVQGTWTVWIDELSDTGGNAETTPHFHPTKLTVTSGTTDVAAPVLSEYDFTPKSVDVATESKTVTVTARVTDATGAVPPTLVLDSDTTTQTLGLGAMTRTSGDATNGLYQRTVAIPTTAATGTWTVTIQPLVDTLDNTAPAAHHHPTKLTVTGAAVGSPPEPPTGVTAVGGNASAQVSWAAPADNGSPITGYTITASPGPRTMTVTGDTTTARLTNLTNGTSYTFTVTATNEHGSSPASQVSPAVTPATLPGRVAKPSLVLKSGKAILVWKAPATGGAKITGYLVSVNGNNTSVPAKPRKLVARALDPGRYKVKVRAINRVGKGAFSQVLKFRIPR